MASKTARAFYVYALKDEIGVVRYIGKGSGRRLKTQERRYGLAGTILEWCKTEAHAYAREISFIATYHPELNIHPGGNGARAQQVRRRRTRDEMEMERVGTRRYTARYLLAKIDTVNCAVFGVSKSDVLRLREVANGPRC